MTEDDTHTVSWKEQSFPTAEAQLCELSEALLQRAASSCLASTSGSGCDSSDCLLCQYKTNCSYDLASVPGKLCSLLRKRSLPRSSWSGALDFVEAGEEQQCSGSVKTHCAVEPGIRETCKRVRGSSDAGSLPVHHDSAHEATHAPEPRLCGVHLAAAWRWLPEYDRRPTPAPAVLLQLADLLPPSAPGRAPARNDLISALEFSPDGRLLACGCVSKQVRLYMVGDLVEQGISSATPFDSSQLYPSLPAAVQRMASKVSCLAWSPDSDGIVTIGDYDGVVTQVHICSGHQLADVDSHAGRRVWGVAHSHHRPFLCASASDDRTCKLWAGRDLAVCAANITPSKASICGVDFSTRDDYTLALGSSDHHVYLYDIRNTRAPVEVLQHHSGPVSYVKFFGNGQLASASTDGSIALWDLQHGPVAVPHHASSAQPLSEYVGSSHPEDPATPTASVQSCATEQQPWQQPHGRAHSSTSANSRSLAHTPASIITPWSSRKPWKIFQGHCNDRHFVGLAVRPEDGLIACGSETSDVFTYHRSWSMPLARSAIPHSCHAQLSAGDAHFVSAVCWQSALASQGLDLPPVLAAGTSQGDIRMLVLAQPEGYQ